MKIGILLPLFRSSIDDATTAALEAEFAGLDGVFAYDHLWPIGKRDAPAFSPFPILASVLAETNTVMVAPLVARVGLVDDSVLLSQFVALNAIRRGRVIAPLGLGDGLSEAENEAYGLDRPDIEARRVRLGGLLDALQGEHIATWVGGSAPKTVAIARAHGAAVNLWASPAALVAEHARTGEVTWAGELPAPGAGLSERLDELYEAGASWVVATYSSKAIDLAHVARSRPWFGSR